MTTQDNNIPTDQAENTFASLHRQLNAFDKWVLDNPDLGMWPTSMDIEASGPGWVRFKWRRYDALPEVKQHTPTQDNATSR